MKISKEHFATSDYGSYLKQVFHKYGWKAIYKQFRPHIRRAYSRELISKFSPTGMGIEIGVGEQTIAPASRTILTDGYRSHANSPSLAKIICPADQIPYDDQTFDYLLSEHTLEHMANPIKTIHEWLRVLKNNGVLFLFLPHKERTFDRYRMRTTLEHLIEDFKTNKNSNDSSHLQDWKENVIQKNLAPHYAQYTPEQTLATGCLHNHVWITEDIVQLLKYLKVDVLLSVDQVPDRDDSFVVIGRKK